MTRRRAGPVERRGPRRLVTRTAGARLIVLTGLSGSGKSQAIRALEDLGYFCVDNLPTTLMPTLAQLTLSAGGELSKAAVVVDVREGRLLEEFPRIYRRLRAMPGLNPVLIFLDASDATLLRRFSETRRPHPLAPRRSVAEGIREERHRLAPIRRLADEVVDSSDTTVHELRQAFMAIAQGRATPAGLVVTLTSFGYKFGLPLDADLVFDVRFLPNPHFVAALRPKTGRDRSVARHVMKCPAAREFLDRTVNLLTFLIPQYVAEGKSYLTIAVGCTGGRHRSVVLVEAMRPLLSKMTGVRVRVNHRDVGIV